MASRNLLYLILISNFTEQLIFLMKSMSYFINWMKLGNSQLAILESSFFKEESHLIWRLYKVIVHNPIIPFGSEQINLLRSRFEIKNEPVNLLPSTIANLRADEIGQNGIAKLMEWMESFLNTHYIMYASIKFLWVLCLRNQFIFSI